MKRTTRSASGEGLKPGSGNVNKPFKSPMPNAAATRTSTSKKPTTMSLLEDIEDSDSDNEDLQDEKLAIEPVARRKEDGKQSSDPESQPKSMSIVNIQEDEIEDIEESQAVPTNKAPVLKKIPGQKRGVFKSKKEREQEHYNQTQDQKRLAAEEKKQKDGMNGSKLKTWSGAASLLAKVNKLDPQITTIPEKTSPKNERKDDPLGLAKYKHVLQTNNIKLDPKLVALLEDNLDSNSDSDDSTSSKKRKRISSGSPDDPIDLDQKPSGNSRGFKKSKSEKYVCPRCRKPVSKELYESYGPELPKRPILQKKLHRSHLLQTAHEDKRKLNIPDIDWDQVGPRCKKHFPVLVDIMEEKIRSRYKQDFEVFLKKKRGKGVTQAKAMFESGDWEKTWPGYYGMRGHSFMADIITRSKEIKAAFARLQKAEHITMVKSSVSAVITNVLVPELAIRLIMEDMNIPSDKVGEGRKMLIETIDMGKLLNPDPDDSENSMDDEFQDGMDYWWAEQEEKRRREQEEEEESGEEEKESQDPICIDGDED